MLNEFLVSLFTTLDIYIAILMYRE